MNSNELQTAILKLNKKRVDKESILKENLNGFKKYFDPVFHVKNALPIEVPIAIRLNNLLNSTISDASYSINGKIATFSKDSLILNYGGTMVSNMVTKKIQKNRTRIKAISLAILKNILN